MFSSNFEIVALSDGDDDAMNVHRMHQNIENPPNTYIVCVQSEKKSDTNKNKTKTKKVQTVESHRPTAEQWQRTEIAR